jgi:S-formylglutathione hydrolase FrmB
MRRSSIERYAAANNLAVVMPNVDRSWYTDTASGANYFAFVTKELPELCYNTFKSFSKKREDHFIGGLSMGGYGALKAALTYPEQYCACISLSGALDIPHYGDQYRKNEMQSIFGFEMESCLELVGGKEDVFALAKENQKKGLPFPKIFMWCGLEDSLLPANRAFDRHLSALGVAHHHEESEGNHSWKWWDMHIQSALAYLLG